MDAVVLELDQAWRVLQRQDSRSRFLEDAWLTKTQYICHEVYAIATMFIDGMHASRALLDLLCAIDDGRRDKSDTVGSASGPCCLLVTRFCRTAY